MVLEHLSASRIKTFEQCPQKYHAKYELKLPDVEHPLTTMGKAVHVGFEKMAGSFLECEKVDVGFLENALRDLKVDSDLHDLARQLTQNALDWGYFRKIALTLGLEMEFDELLPNGVKVNGFIDRLDVDGDTADVIDLKTQKKEFSGKELQTDWQARIYNWATRKILPIVTGDVMVSFWVLRHKVQRVIKTAEDAARDEEALIQVSETILNCESPEAIPSRLCPWCPKYDTCDTAGNRWLKSGKPQS